MKRDVRNTLERQLSAVDFTARDRANVLRRMRGEQRTVKRKISFGLALALSLTVLSMTAVAVGIAVNALYGNVIQMEAQQQLLRWELEDKLAFVTAIREAGLEMDEGDWAILSDEAQGEEARSAAADRIVYARYGELQEEQNAGFVQPRESVYGEAPDIEVVFGERYWAEHPDASEQDYLDAWGYFMRDEYGTIYDAMLQEAAEQTPEERALDEQSALSCLRTAITDIYNWGQAARDSAAYTAAYDAQCGVWLVSAEVKDADMKDAFDPLTEWETVERTDGGYRLTLAVGLDAAGGFQIAATAQACAELIEKINREDALYTIHIDEAMEVARRAVQEKYGLTDEQARGYFIREADLYTDDPSCIREGLYFNAHNTYAAAWDYAVIVNFTTGQADDVFTPDDLWDRLPKLGEAYFELDCETFLQYMRWYTTWNPFGRFDEWPQEAQAAAMEGLVEAKAADFAAAGSQDTMLLDRYSFGPME